MTLIRICYSLFPFLYPLILFPGFSFPPLSRLFCFSRLSSTSLFLLSGAHANVGFTNPTVYTSSTLRIVPISTQPQDFLVFTRVFCFVPFFFFLFFRCLVPNILFFSFSPLFTGFQMSAVSISVFGESNQAPCFVFISEINKVGDQSES